MFASSWLCHLERRWFGGHALRRVPVRRVRPRLEVLEDRLTPSVVPINVNDNRDVLDNPANVTVAQLGPVLLSVMLAAGKAEMSRGIACGSHSRRKEGCRNRPLTRGCRRLSRFLLPPRSLRKNLGAEPVLESVSCPSPQRSGV
jgi:hypothetical protein